MAGLRQYELAEASEARAVELAEKYQFPDLAAMSRCILGHMRAILGRATEGIGLIGQGAAELLKVGARLGSTSSYPTYLAVALERKGAIDEALETIEQALQGGSGVLYYRPESLRIRGELRIRHAEPKLAEVDFRDSIAMARTMSAKAWELRATMSLARLLRDTGRRDQARTMLAEIYNWFTEGFDTLDLIDAKALLDELSN